MTNFFTTIIIPSLGRESIKKSLQSLEQQTDPDYKVIIVYDSAPINVFATSMAPGRITTIQLSEKIGHAGLVRNVAFPLVDTEWISFLDDDDYFKDTYIAKLKSYAGIMDIVSFTYRDLSNGNTQPPPGMYEMKYCNIGISFSVRTKFIRDHNISFRNVECEDWFFLEDCMKAGALYVVTGEIEYFVSKRSVWQ